MVEELLHHFCCLECKRLCGGMFQTCFKCGRRGQVLQSHPLPISPLLQTRERINGNVKRVIWDCSLQSDSGHPFSSPLSKNSRNTVYKLRFANVLGRINLKTVIWECSLQSDSEHPIFSPLSKNSRNTVTNYLEGREPPLTLRQEKRHLYFGHLFPCTPRPFSL